MKSLPRLNTKTGFNDSPHIVILGAGASRACCPQGDRNSKRLPLMLDLVETVGIEELVRNCGDNPKGNFEAIYSKIHRANHTIALDEIDEAVRTFFGQIELPEEPTIYDYLILSLRPKDLILSFNWDPLLPQAYRRWRKLGRVLPQLAFLHGNIDVGYDSKAKNCGFLIDKPELTPTPLLYPVEQKNYNSNPFIEDQWKLATVHLAQAYYVTIFGYSAPVTDIEAKALFLEAWRTNPTHTLAEFDIIDIRDADQVKNSWSDFIVRSHGAAFDDIRNSILFQHPRRTCEAFAFATLQQAPWRKDSFEDFQSLSQLEDWIMPLIEEEDSGKLSRIPHH